MARISNVEKALYTRLSESDDAPCYYCGCPSSMDDLTPSPKAGVADRQMFREAWTVVRTCRKCWGRIYTANIANTGARFHVPKGCMTIAQKKALIGKVETSSATYTFNHDRTLVIPVDMAKVENGPFVYKGQSYHEEEVEMLQGALMCRMHGLDERIVRKQFSAAMASGDLEMDREPLYRELLGLSEDSEEMW